MPHYLYLITDGEHTKIGISSNPENRLIALQTSNPKRLSIIRLVEFGDIKHCQIFERHMHKHFKQSHAFGEWFKLNLHEIEAGIAACQASAKQAFQKWIDSHTQPLTAIDKVLMKPEGRSLAVVFEDMGHFSYRKFKTPQERLDYLVWKDTRQSIRYAPREVQGGMVYVALGYIPVAKVKGRS